MQEDIVQSKKDFLWRSIKITIYLLIFCSLVMVMLQRAHWVIAAWITCGWLALNNIMLVRIMQMVNSQPADDSKKKIMVICLIKFPLLYLIGLALLLLPFVFAEGVLISFTLYLLVMGTLWCMAKITNKK